MPGRSAERPKTRGQSAGSQRSQKDDGTAHHTPKKRPQVQFEDGDKSKTENVGESKGRRQKEPIVPAIKAPEKKKKVIKEEPIMIEKEDTDE